MKHTTVCYIENDGKYLMIHRIKKKNDENGGKWIGVGGKLEEGESPFDCVRREVKEETGLTISHPSYRGFITFVSDIFGTEYMHLFTAKNFEGTLRSDCPEGVLKWVDKSDIPTLPRWEGDKVFMSLLDTDTPFFSLRLEYSGDTLIGSKLEY